MNVLKMLLMLGFMVLAVGCNEYTTQICTSQYLTDVPGIEGNRTAVSYDTQNHKVQTTPVTIQHVGTGSYIGNGAAFSTCQFGIGGSTFAEIYNPSHSTYTSYILTMGNLNSAAASYFDLALAGFDKGELDNAGIPNSTVTYSSNDQAFVVNNANVSPQTLVGFFHPLSFVIRFY